MSYGETSAIFIIAPPATPQAERRRDGKADCPPHVPPFPPLRLYACPTPARPSAPERAPTRDTDSRERSGGVPRRSRGGHATASCAPRRRHGDRPVFDRGRLCTRSRSGCWRGRRFLP